MYEYKFEEAFKNKDIKEISKILYNKGYRKVVEGLPNLSVFPKGESAITIETDDEGFFKNGGLIYLC